MRAALRGAGAAVAQRSRAGVAVTAAPSAETALCAALTDPGWLCALRRAYGSAAGEPRARARAAQRSDVRRPPRVSSRGPAAAAVPRRSAPAAASGAPQLSANELVRPAPSPPLGSDAHRTDPYSLNHALVSAQSTEEVLSIVESQGVRLNAVNLSTAWHRLGTQCRGSAPLSASVRSDDRLRSLEAHTLSALHRGAFAPQSVSNTLWACGALGHSPEAAITRELLAALTRQLPAFSPLALSNAAWAAAVLRFEGAEELMRLIWHQVGTRLDDFAPQGVANLLWATATLRVYPGYATADRVARMVSGHARLFKAQELSATAWAFAELRHYPGRKALTALDESFAQRMEEFSPQATSNVLWACAVFMHRPHRALQALQDAYASPPPPPPPGAAQGEARRMHLPEQFCTQDVARLAWSLAVLYAFDLPLFASVWRAAAALPPEAFAPEGLRSIYQTHLLARASSSATPEDALLPPPLRRACEISLRQRALEPIVSELHVRVCSVLASMGVIHHVEQLTEDGLFSIDVAIFGANGVKIALEVDGPFHFSVNARSLLGRTVARNRLLRARGWHVAAVPFFEWNALRNSYEQKLYLSDKLRGAEQARGTRGTMRAEE